MTTQKQNKRTQISIPRVGFEPTILVFEREKTVHALERAATVIGNYIVNDMDIGARGISRKVARSISDEVIEFFFNLPLPFSRKNNPGIDSVSNRN
jgi:hypothetical protein